MQPPSVDHSISPNLSLSEFVRTELAEPEEWDEFIRTGTASEPKSRTVLEQGLPVHIVDEPSADFVRHNQLDGIFLTRFREALSSEDWVLSGFTERSHRREVIEAELVARMDNISFLHSRVGTLRHVEIKLSSVDSLFLRMKWAIEQICAVVPAKMGVSKHDVHTLVQRLLKREIRADLFNAAWDEAVISKLWKKPGPKAGPRDYL